MLQVMKKLDQIFYDFKGWEGHSGQTQGIQSESLSVLIKSLPPNARCLEIGFNCGHSAALILSARPDVTLVSLDNAFHPYVNAAQKVIQDFFPKRHMLVIGDSTITLPTLLGEFDMYFVDGCHEYEVAKKDVENVLLRARSMDLIILDDVTLDIDIKNVSLWAQGPTRLWNELVNEKRIAPRGSIYVEEINRGWAFGNPYMGNQKVRVFNALQQKQEEAKYFYFSSNEICNVNCEINVFDNEIAHILYERGANERLSLKSLNIILTHVSIMNRALNDDCIDEVQIITIQALGEKYITNKKCIERALRKFNQKIMPLQELLSDDSSISTAPE
jgi:predicted O-methyltransferase YrrM